MPPARSLLSRMYAGHFVDVCPGSREAQGRPPQHIQSSGAPVDPGLALVTTASDALAPPPFALSPIMDVGEADINNTAVDTVRVFHDSDEEALNSDEEENNNSEGWYTALVAGNTGEDTLIDEAGDGVEGNWSDDGPDGEYGANLLRLQKNRSQRELSKQRVATAKARVSRDWKTATTNWDMMSNEEKELLAMDVEALAKMRVDGWKFGTYFIC
ncbi:hypothetical protein PInf_022046 [Phytophthora infestans]|nr:hypothetical protein PInf_022046 [Phytophthora infestans]